MKANLWPILWLQAIALGAQAETLPPGERSGIEAVIEAESRDVLNERAAALSWRYDIPQADIRALRQNGMKWEDIEQALALSVRAKKPLHKILKLRDSGLDWGEIAGKYGLKHGDSVSRAPRSEPLHDALQEPNAPRSKDKTRSKVKRNQNPRLTRQDQLRKTAAAAKQRSDLPPLDQSQTRPAP